MKTAAIILFSLLAFTSVPAQPDRVAGWSNDIDFLLAKVREQHYVYKAKPLPAEMLRRAGELKNRAAEYSDERMLIELQQLSYFLGDGHSYMLPLAARITESKFLPLQLYEFSDGMFVVDADEPNTRLIGMKVKSIGGVSPDKIMRDMSSFISQDNRFGARWIGPTFMRARGLLERYGLVKGSESVVITFEDGHGIRIETPVRFVPPSGFTGIPKLVPPKGAPAPVYLENVRDNFWFRHMPDKGLVYFQFNQVMNKPAESLAAFAGKLDSALKAKNPRLLIVDVRHNNGGNGNLLPPLVKVLSDFERSQKGRIVVLTGRNTFSAAQIFIGLVDGATDAVFAGEPSSSKPNFVGEENEVVLPYSGARGSISNRFHESIPGDKRQWIEPAIKVVVSSKDYFAGRDPVLEAVLRKYAR
jgi:hypothetical protein